MILSNTNIKVIIPAYNEALSIGSVIAEIPTIVNEIIVVNNNSTDATAKIAEAAGATVLLEYNRGYGHACLKGLSYIKTLATVPDIVVFLDGDYSDYPKELIQLVAPIINNNTDFVLGARVKKLRQKNAMMPQQIFGNVLATFLMRILFKSTFTDLGPFRAIKYTVLQELHMQDKTYGWTVEMQLKILKMKFSYIEVPVQYKARIGISKVSGTISGTIMAGVKIISWILKYAFK